MRTSDGQDQNGASREAKLGRAVAVQRHRRQLFLAVGITAALAAITTVVAVGQDRDRAPAPVPGVPLSTETPARTAAGAQQAAALIAQETGGPAMFDPTTRHTLIQRITDPAAVAALQASLDAAYTAEFNARMGLDRSGHPVGGGEFTNTTRPASTAVTAYSDTAATISVWCSGRLSRTGGQHPIPGRTSWFTMTITVTWVSTGEWRLSSYTQSDGPTPDHAPTGQTLIR